MDSSRNGIYTLQGPKLLPLYTLAEDEPQELWFANSPVFAQGQVFFLYGSSAKEACSMPLIRKRKRLPPPG